MCKETERELKVGKDLAKKLVDHLKTMGAESCEIPVGEYVITVSNVKKSVDCKDEIIKELCKAVKVLGATSDLLAITGSYGDTLDDKEVIRMFKEWNDFDRSLFEDWTWQKQLVGIMLNPQDKEVKNHIISKAKTPKLFDIFLKLAKLYFPHKEEKDEESKNDV